MANQTNTGPLSKKELLVLKQIKKRRELAKMNGLTGPQNLQEVERQNNLQQEDLIASKLMLRRLLKVVQPDEEQAA
ncbi:MAG: hypothetical protein ACE5G8_11745 [Anaerolineae bacterium]